MAAPALDRIAAEYAPHGFASVFFYTREAHPGEHFPAHRTFAQKLARARAFRERFGIERPILVDDVIGTGHRQYGILPNMAYLIGRDGRVLFRSDWTDPPTIEMAVRYRLDVRIRRRDGLRLSTFFAELVGYRWSDPTAFERGLAVAGPQAITDFAQARGQWERERRARERIETGD